MYAYRKQGKPNSKQYSFIKYKLADKFDTFLRFIAKELERKVTDIFVT